MSIPKDILVRDWRVNLKMGEIPVGSPSYTLTELLHAINVVMRMTELATQAAETFEKLGLHVSDGYVYQNLKTEE